MSQNIAVFYTDYSFAVEIKLSIEKEFGKEVSVEIFNDEILFLKFIIDKINKPLIIVLDYLENIKKTVDDTFAVDSIKKASRETHIIILSKPENMEHALKALGHGAQTFVLKDMFQLKNINDKIKDCLYPGKM